MTHADVPQIVLSSYPPSVCTAVPLVIFTGDEVSIIVANQKIVVTKAQARSIAKIIDNVTPIVRRAIPDFKLV